MSKRETAATWCAMMASSNCELMEQIVNGAAEHQSLFTDACGKRRLSTPEADLAREAFWYACSLQRTGMTLDAVLATPLDARAAWAEAESLIRTGWSP